MGGIKDTSAVESLYPFLYAQSNDVDAVLAEVRQSTVDKARYVMQLREQVLERDADRIAACAAGMADAFAAGGQLFSFGNGGSCTDAQTLASLCVHPRSGERALPAISLTGDAAVMTALSNDIGFEVVFARQLGAFGKASDIAVGISTSGNSENLLRAFEEAGRRGMLTIGLSGYDGGKMAELGCIDHLFVVPSTAIPRIQEVQTTIYHCLWELTVAALRDRSNAPEPPLHGGEPRDHRGTGRTTRH